MSSINPEMLKQLLSEFEEKQAVCREEINEINNQIQELELRIESSKERLVSVARDREKISLMKQRYQDGDWSAVLSQIQKNSNGSSTNTGAGLTTQKAIDPPMAQTGDYPPVSIPPKVEAAPAAPKADAPPANLAPQSVIAPPSAQEFPPSFISEPAPAPAPAPAVAEAVPAPDFSMPAPAAEAAPPNPFEQAPPAPVASPPGMQLDVNWDAPQPQGYPAEAPAPTPAPAPAPSEGLFSFSGQPAPDAAGGADIPWAPPPTMSWESVGNHTFPNQGVPDPSQQFPPAPPQQQQQPPAFQTPPGFPDTAAFGAAPAPFAQPDMPAQGGVHDPSQAPPPGPPGGFMSPPSTPVPPPTNQAVLTTAFDDEFDISDALRGEDESGNSDSRDNDKKIKDALRGLFS